MKKPLIGITGPRERGHAAWIFSRNMLRMAGARVRRLRPGQAFDIARLDGLVLGGGSDLDPVLWQGGDGADAADALDGDPPPAGSERDRFELDLLARSRERELPILGICRGAQLLNVAAGGTLFEDILERRPPHWRKRIFNSTLGVNVRPDSRLAGALNTSRVFVNNLHHQAVDQVGDGLRIVARDDHGIVQAIEGVDEVFTVGVQWHPEYLFTSAPQRRLFATLVACASTRMSKKARPSKASTPAAKDPSLATKQLLTG